MCSGDIDVKIAAFSPQNMYFARSPRYRDHDIAERKFLQDDDVRLVHAIFHVQIAMNHQIMSFVSKLHAGRFRLELLSLLVTPKIS